MDPQIVAELASPLGRELIRLVQPYRDDRVLKQHTKMRELGHRPELISAVLTQAKLQERAKVKFGDSAADLLFTSDGVEQATRAEVAALHADRFVAAGLKDHWDLGCGIGADARAVAGAGLPVTAVEMNPGTAAIAAANLADFEHARVVTAAIESLDLNFGSDTSIWLDPARRVAGVSDASGRSQRISGLEEMSPPWSLVQELATQSGAAGAKYSPGFPAQSIPVAAEAVWVSFAGVALECSLWWGAAVESPGRSVVRSLAGHPREWARLSDADVAPSWQTHRAWPELEPGMFLYDPDKAALAADLLGAVASIVGADEVGPATGYLVSREQIDTGWARRWRIREVLPLNVKAIRAWARSHNVGNLTLKRRGHGPDPEVLRKQLKLKGKAEATLVLTRAGEELVAIWVELDGPSHAGSRT
ncbi:class I SAM-dependent methyltransferase [Ornithinimicrobium sp. Arc0846-15]|nr:class I SAM-dependent methyltransferase [Ornithinimicrobium laminariae]